VRFNDIAKNGLMALLILLLVLGLTVPCFAQDNGAINDGNKYVQGQLPRWREGGTPYDDMQSLMPRMITPAVQKDMPTTGMIYSPPEYSPSRGVLFSYFSNGWPTVVRDLVVALTADPTHDEIAYVVVANSSQLSSATTLFTAGGADMSKVEFIIEPMDAVWIRDFGPHFIWQDSTIGIVNSQYYPTRTLDNFIPALLGEDHFQMATYDMGLYYSGGNFQPGPGRSGFVTALINLDNPVSGGFDADFLAGLYQTYQGIDTLHIMPQLPFTVDGTGHIDMWMYIVDDSTVIISEFLPGSNSQAITITENAVPYMESLGFEVFRTPAWNAPHPDNGYSTHWTYTNALRVNDRIFISTFGELYPDYADEDAQALAVWEEAAGPEVEIVPINSFPIIWAAGAIHCITMQVPCYSSPQPKAHITWPAGGELLVSGTTATIQWGAVDSNNADLSEVVLYYSTDNGSNYELIDTVPDTGLYDWTVPDLFTEQALVKVVAVSADAEEYEAVSEGVFQIDRFCKGVQTLNWASIDGNRTPVGIEVPSYNYARMAYSDATGTDSDPNRYISSNPAYGYESTHIFEFTIKEDPAEIDDIGVLWEGYSDQCSMMEMYIWDYTDEQWCDADGNYNQNRFMDNWAGNRDGYLEKHVRSELDRYINAEGQMTVLLYSERGPDGSYVTYNPTFHDYFSITVSDILPQYLCGDADASGSVNVSDAVRIINFVFMIAEPPDPIESGDCNCDGLCNISDAVAIVNYVFVGGNAPCDTNGDDIPDC
jgi:agmatine/peptidylarginine deiminase